jgi:glycerol kinase
MENRFILALDEGTTSARAMLFDPGCNIVGIEQKEITQIFPKPGWVEQDPLEILEMQIAVARDVLKNNNVSPQQIAAIGITNQRETTVVWNKHTGKPVFNAIVWQDRRTAAYCKELKEFGLSDYIKENTGLVIDAYFSGTKLKWILDYVSANNPDIKINDLIFGTIDSWIIWHLTGGQVHATDYTNASRTLLYNIKEFKWDERLLRQMNIPEQMLPDVRSSSGDFGKTDPKWFDGVKIPIRGVAGDQQAALFGQACFEPGMSKNTYGTGCFMLMNTGEKMVNSNHGLLTTLACGPEGQVNYALEGSIFVAGAAIQWLRDRLKMIDESPDSEFFASKVTDSGGVYVVPAFAGLGAPYWDMYARGAILGLTLGTTKEHIIRATLESLAYQTKDVLDVMEKDSGIELLTLRVDGGATANNLLMEFQADILNVPVERPAITETTALGAAYLAGLAVGYWKQEELAANWRVDLRFNPEMKEAERTKKYKGWQKAVSRARDWAED